MPAAGSSPVTRRTSCSPSAAGTELGDDADEGHAFALAAHVDLAAPDRAQLQRPVRIAGLEGDERAVNVARAVHDAAECHHGTEGPDGQRRLLERRRAERAL